MTALFIIGLVLVVAFALSFSAYLTIYKFNIVNNILKGVVFILLALVIALVTLALAIIALWPAY